MDAAVPPTARPPRAVSVPVDAVAAFGAGPRPLPRVVLAARVAVPAVAVRLRPWVLFRVVADALFGAALPVRFAVVVPRGAVLFRAVAVLGT